MLTKRRVVVAKIENTEGGGETLTAADGGILAIDPKVDVDIKMHQRRPAMATLSNLGSVPGARLARLTFRAELKGAGSAYSSSNLPAVGKYLRGCGFSETVDTTAGAETVTYKPASSGMPSLTIGCYEDGVVKRVIGARGNVKIVGKVGEPCFAEFDFLGVWDGLTDGAMLVPTFEGTKPPPLLAANFSIASYAAVIAGFEIDMGVMLKLREDANKAAGYIAAAITGREPSGRFDPEMVTVATHDYFGRWQAGTPGALNIGEIGDSQYNKVKITAPNVLYKMVSDAEREGVAVADTAFELAMNTGDDEVEIVFS